MPDPSRGYLTMAVGKLRYVEMAVDMVLSLREHTELPIAIAVDPVLDPLVAERYSNVFDQVVLVPQRFLDGRALKYGTAAATPFDETMFVDADCIVLDSLDGLFSILESTDMAMVGERLTSSQDQNHHGFSTRTLMRRFDLDHYLKTNSGLFCFRREPGVQIMEECLECYLHEARPRLRWSLLFGRWLGDEIAFGIVGGRRGISTFPDPSPMYWPTEFATLDLDRPTKPLLHMIWPPPPETLDHLVATTRERRRAAGVCGDGEQQWREEVRHLERMADRRRFLEILRWW
jgi:hypothetical protein